MQVQSRCRGAGQVESRWRAVQRWCRAGEEQVQSRCRAGAEQVQSRCRAGAMQVQSRCRCSCRAGAGVTEVLHRFLLQSEAVQRCEVLQRAGAEEYVEVLQRLGNGSEVQRKRGCRYGVVICK